MIFFCLSPKAASAALNPPLLLLYHPHPTLISILLNLRREKKDPSCRIFVGLENFALYLSRLRLLARVTLYYIWTAKSNSLDLLGRPWMMSRSDMRTTVLYCTYRVSRKNDCAEVSHGAALLGRFVCLCARACTASVRVCSSTGQIHSMRQVFASATTHSDVTLITWVFSWCDDTSKSVRCRYCVNFSIWRPGIRSSAHFTTTWKSMPRLRTYFIIQRLNTTTQQPERVSEKKNTTRAQH